MGTRGCGARRTTSDACVPRSAGRRGGKRPAPPGLWGDGARRALPRRRGRQKQQRRRRRVRPREAHAAAHLRIVPVDAPSTLDQPPELRLVAVICGLEHGLARRVAHRVRRALQARTRLDTCGFGGGTRGSAVTLGRRRRALRRGAHAARPHAPRSSGGGGGSRVARGRVEDARSDHGALPQRLAPKAPSRWYGRAKQLKLPRPRTCAMQAIGLDEGGIPAGLPS